jgi:hypothetical protein
MNFETSDGKRYVLPAGDRNYNYVRRTITKNDHPNPILIAFIIISVLILLYYVKHRIYKLNLSGKWYNQDGLITIDHCQLYDLIIVSGRQMGRLSGKVDGSAICLHGVDDALYTGVYHKGHIHWNNGDIWRSPTYTH